MKKSVRILIADDHEIIRNGVKLMLSKQEVITPVISEAANGEEFIRVIENEKFDVVLLDINLPNYSGIKLAKFLSEKSRHVKIIALTMHTEGYIIQEMLQAGAHGYLTKNTGIEELTKAITTVLAGYKYFCNEIAQTLIANSEIKFDKSGAKKVNAKGYIQLSEHEKKIIKLVSREYTNSEIADKLNISKRTVENHRRNIMTKLNVQNTAGLIVFAAKNGII